MYIHACIHTHVYILACTRMYRARERERKRERVGEREGTRERERERERHTDREWEREGSGRITHPRIPAE